PPPVRRQSGKGGRAPARRSRGTRARRALAQRPGPGPTSPPALRAGSGPGRRRSARCSSRSVTWSVRPPWTPSRSRPPQRPPRPPGRPGGPPSRARTLVMATRPGALAGARIAGERFVRSRRQHNPEGRMPLLEHLRELRNRVVKIALALAAGMTAGFVFFGPAWHVIERPLCSATIRGHSGCRTLGVDQLVLNGPLDAFYLRVKVALIAGAIVSSPVWLYQVWAFAAPGLHAREKRWSCLFLGAALPLFGIGCTLCYLSLGRSMGYLLGLTPGGAANLIQVDQHLSFVMAM